MALRHVMSNGVQRPKGPPGGVVDVLVASKDGKRPAGLEHIPWETRVLVDSRPGWAASANALLARAAETGHDALFVDDDVTILPGTFEGFGHYYPLADVFGFRLLGQPGQEPQVGWGLQYPNPFPDRACYAAHVTASLMYIRADVLARGKLRFPVWPGIHFEDLAFTYQCWFQGFAVAYVPSSALHDIAEAPGGMVGATKRLEPDLEARRQINHAHLNQWIIDCDIKKAADHGRIPFGVWGIDP